MPHPTAIAFFTMDVRWLARRGGLRPGSTMGVVETVNGRVRGSTEVHALDDQTLRVGRQLVELARTVPNFGGSRPWFVCPRCDRRVAILYGPGPFACRRCHGVAYPSQRATVRDRRLVQAQDIRLRLGGTANMLEPFPARPRGMHRSTYDRSAAKYVRIADAALALTAARVEKLARSVAG